MQSQQRRAEVRQVLRSTGTAVQAKNAWPGRANPDHSVIL